MICDSREGGLYASQNGSNARCGENANATGKQLQSMDPFCSLSWTTKSGACLICACKSWPKKHSHFTQSIASVLVLLRFAGYLFAHRAEKSRLKPHLSVKNASKFFVIVNLVWDHWAWMLHDVRRLGQVRCERRPEKKIYRAFICPLGHYCWPWKQWVDRFSLTVLWQFRLNNELFLARFAVTIWLSAGQTPKMHLNFGFISFRSSIESHLNFCYVSNFGGNLKEINKIKTFLFFSHKILTICP